MDDYSRIAKVIRYLDEHHGEQPSLSDLAKIVDLSESHFHRLFRRWAGITPKDFLQCLTTEHARERLQNSETVFDAAIESGLSGPGRLHDLTTTLVAATPGEIRNGGSKLTISHGTGETPFGRATLGWTARGICHLGFNEEQLGPGIPDRISTDWPNATIHHDPSEAQARLDQIFSADKPGAGLTAFVRGTPFQILVWRALLQIPEGKLTSYSKLAEAVGSKGASRAVGSACGKNPIGYLIPCHRVIRETGIVTGYRWGTDRKRILLAREGALSSKELRREC
ncbi:MAG: methylated-DNA--[protein]-cysteine S-methyltransferase [Verrucomicrobiales bacterium]|nr:methylated-DNA--[protein]-cysteine S-methyltransferase [Verrucomicrobiales bacterium]